MRYVSRIALAVTLALASWGAWANKYTIVSVGSFDDVLPMAINEKGQLAGNAFLGHTIHGMFYRKGNWQKLGSYSWATAINTAGDVGGYFESQSSRAWQGFIWPKQGAPIYIDAGAPAQIAGLNDERVALGTFRGSPRSFVWTREGGAVDLGMMGQGKQCEAFAINNAGQVTGRATANRNGRFHAFLWKNGQFQDLGRLPGYDDTEGHAINGRGEVVGHATKDGAQHAFHWNGTRMIDLDPQLSFAGTVATAINDAGEIVGMASTNPNFVQGAARFADGKVIPLLSEVEDPGNWSLWTVVGINKDGVIVGDGNLGGFMLIPHTQSSTNLN